MSLTSGVMARPSKPGRALCLGLLHKLCFQQGAGTVRGRNLQVTVLPLEANKLANCGFNFLLSHAAHPTGCQVRFNPLCLTLREFAIDGQEQFLIGEMRFF